MTDSVRSGSPYLGTIEKTNRSRRTSDEPLGTNVEISTAVVCAVADAEDADPLDLGPLDDVVDPDALDTLFDPTGAGKQRSGGRVTFTLSEHEVTVHSDGRIELRPIETE